MRGLYVHIPFCIKKCNYCDFNSVKITNESKLEFIQALLNEFDLYSKDLEEIEFDTLFIGGGTPTILEIDELKLILETIKCKFKLKKDAEITIESNPKTIDKKKAFAMKELGINRISMGIQAVQDKHLKFLGRIHSFEEARENINILKEAGFENINVDLMFAFPNQTMDDWKESIREILKLELPHISGYSLIIEEGTKLGDLYDESKIQDFDEDLDRKMYYFMKTELKKYGYEQYEISNFAKPGFSSKHNTIYWKCFEYLGFGPGAHSFFRNFRYSNKEDLKEYKRLIDNGQKPIEENTNLSQKDLLEEKIFMGLRMNEGIDIEKINEDFSVDILDIYDNEISELKKEGLVELKEGFLRLTELGIDLSNKVFVKFLR